MRHVYTERGKGTRTTHAEVHIRQRVGCVFDDPVPLLPQKMCPRQRRRVSVQLLKKKQHKKKAEGTHGSTAKKNGNITEQKGQAALLCQHRQ